ncbi:MAG: hypothetical protein ACRERX_17155 [Pseudomonas sp.]
MKRNAVIVTAALAALGLGSPAISFAQGITVTPLVGAYVPGGSFHDLQDQAGELKRGSTMGLGLNIGLGMLRGTVAYATGATISEDGVTGESEIGDGSVLVGAADLVLRPLPRLVFFQPYALGGLGYKKESYSFDDQGFDELDDGDNDVVLHIGLGVDISLGRLSLVAEISDFIGRNNNDDWKVHDAFGMVGLKLNLF